MNADLTDKLELLGILAGAALVVVAAGTVAGTPWQTNNDGLASVLQLVGVVAMIGIGIGLAWLSSSQE
jgi:uncharacterized membrane protein YadS